VTSIWLPDDAGNADSSTTSGWWPNTSVGCDQGERCRLGRDAVGERLVIVGLAGFQAGELDVVVRRLMRDVVGEPVQLVRPGAVANLTVGGRGRHLADAVVGAGNPGEPRDDGVVLRQGSE